MRKVNLLVPLGALALLGLLAIIATGCGGGSEQEPPTAPSFLPPPKAAVALVPPPQIPHDLEGRDNCLMCHEGGTVNAPIVPSDHTGIHNEGCRRCHVVNVQPIAMTVAAPPPQIPHPVKGRGDCLMCHRLGIGQAPRHPDDHAGRGNDLCPICHVALATSQLSGKEIFDSVCARCHGVNGQGGVSPALNTREFLTTRSDAAIRQAILKGRGVSEMLSWGDLGLLTDDQIDDVVAYIRSWEATAPSVVASPAVGRLTASRGRVSEGKHLFAQFCSGCHGIDGEKEIGGVVLHSDELLERLDDVSIAYYVRDGGQNMPSFHALLTTDQLDDLLALMRSWQNGQRLAAAAAPTLSGSEIFDRVCARCHGANGEGGAGPALNSRQYLTTHDDEGVRDHIERGTLGTSMLSWGDLGLLTQAQIDDLVAFIRGWEATAPVVAEVRRQPASAARGTASEGEKLFAQFCSGCHGLHGEVELGGVVLHSERWLTQHSDEAIARQISEGGRAMPSFHAILTHENLNDLLALLRSWQPAPTTPTPLGPVSDRATPTPVIPTATLPPAVPTATPVEARVPSFASDVMPILQAKCAACHGSVGGWSAATYEDVVNSGDNGPAVIPGDPENSLLLQKLKGTQTLGGPMPLAGPLSADEIALIEAWIAVGAPNR